MESRGIIGRESQLYSELARMVDAGEQGVLATVIQARRSTPRDEGSKMIIHADGRITGSVGGGKAESVVIDAAQKVMDKGGCQTIDLDLAKDLGVCGGDMKVFLEPILQSVPLVVIGAGHVGRAMVDLARFLPFRITVIDDREEFLPPLSAISGVTTIHGGPEELETYLAVSPQGAILVASRGHDLDGAYLEQLIRMEGQEKAEFGFLGVLGSRTKASRIRDRIAAISSEAARRVENIQMPVGLDIGAETPHEIALSVLAEMQAVLSGRADLKDEAGQPLGVRFHRRRGN